MQYLIFHSTGFSRQPFFRSGEIVESIQARSRRHHLVKYGSESKFTAGTLKLFQTHARLENISLDIEEGFGPHDMTSVNRFRMFGQLEVYSNTGETFAKMGDSGSLVFMLRNNKEDDLVCIGMVVGMSSHGSCIMTPISNVLSALNLPLRLARFEQPISAQPEAHASNATSHDSTQLILGSIQLLKQSIDAMENKFEMRFISLERKVHGLTSTQNDSESIATNLQRNNTGRNPSQDDDHYSDESLNVISECKIL